MSRFDVIVVGSCMTDLITNVARMPKMGETLVGKSFSIGFGGKGANQAVMSARLGARTAMVARVGDDVFGRTTLENFTAHAVDARHVKIVFGATSGVAPITVQEDGQNIVLIVPGANAHLDPAGVREAQATIRDSAAVLCQLEVPEAAVLEAFMLAKNASSTTILNPAPAAQLDEAILALTDYIVPNETELEILTGCTTDTLEGAEEGARLLLQHGVRVVVVTLGARGALIVDEQGTRHYGAPDVRAVDTTGAGDAFVGTMATLVTRGQAIDAAVQWSCKVASISVTKPGTQTSFPTVQQLREQGIDIPAELG